MATASLIATGCVMLRKCHLNTCSVGIATQDPELRKKFTGKPEDVVAYFTFVAEGVRRRLAELGARSLDEVIGRVEYLKVRKRTLKKHAKTRDLDLSRDRRGADLAHEAAAAVRAARSRGRSRITSITSSSTRERARRSTRSTIELPIDNSKRAAGTLLSGELARSATARRGLPDGSINVQLTGSAGQSFGAFLVAGRHARAARRRERLHRQGPVGRPHRSCSPPAGARFAPEDNVIIGNVALYGATAGDLFANGLGGERFAVRNSGARAVVEGVGDHGCEYMTGGVVVVLGPVGRNFAAGMSGGTAFVFDPAQTFRSALQPRDGRARAARRRERPVARPRPDRRSRAAHRQPARQEAARQLGPPVARFVKVMPTEYKRVLERRRSTRGRSVVGSRMNRRREGSSPMGKPTGFIEWPRAAPHRRPDRRAPARLARSRAPPTIQPSRASKAAAAWTAACRSARRAARSAIRSPTSRTRSGPIAGTTRTASSRVDERVPRVHRPALPGPVRSGVRARDRQRARHDRAPRARDHRARVRPKAGSTPRPPTRAHRQARRDRRLGPAGLAAAAQLNRAGHTAIVYEARRAPGGLLRYGIPDFKMEKHVIDRRLAILDGRRRRAALRRRRSASTHRRGSSCARITTRS